MKIAVSAVGCWTALADNPAALFEALCAGKSAIEGPGPFPGRGPVAAIPGGPHRSSTLALHAARQALQHRPKGVIGVVGASTSGDMVIGEVAYKQNLTDGSLGPNFIWPQLADRPAEVVARELSLHGPRLSMSTACSSGAAAVGIAAEWVRSGRADAVLAVGADALCQMTVHGFGSLGAISADRCRPFDAARTGLSLGEGAGALLIEPYDHATARGVRPLALIEGYGNATDAHHMTAPHPEGRGAIAAIEQAGTNQVGWVCAHGTATPLNDAMEAKVLAQLMPTAAVSSVKGAIGHTLGAAGAIELVITALALQQQRIPPNTGCRTSELGLNLVNKARALDLHAALSVNFAFGGHNAAVRMSRC